METESLTESLQETLSIFDASGEPRTTPEIAERLDLGRRSAYARLERLVEHGRLETKKVGANARVWWRSPPKTEVAASDRSAAAESLVVDVIEDLEVGVFVLDENFEVVWINTATERHFQLDREQAIGSDKRRLINEHISRRVEDDESFAETVLATYDDNTHIERFECRVTTGDEREERWLEHRSKPIESGEFAGGRIELYYDITDRKRSEQTRRKESKRFESLVEAVEEYAIFTLDTEGFVRTWNSGAEQIKGYEADEILREHFSVFYTDEDTAAGKPEDTLSEAVNHGSVEDEGWRVRADGSRFWADVTITAIRNEDGDLEGYAKTTRDMTQQRKYEKELRRQRDFTQRILETIPIGVLTVEPDGTFTTANQRAVELLELESDSDGTYTVGVNDVYDEDGESLAPGNRPYVQAFETGESVRNWHAQLESSNGGWRWVSTNIEPMVDEKGDIERILVTIEDISQLKEQAALLERQRDELESELDEILGRISNAFYALDDEWQFTHVNERAEELIGFKGEELVGKNVWETFKGAAQSELRDEYERAMEIQESTSFELYFPDPFESWFEINAYPSETGLSVYFQDITERKERERALRESEHRYRTLVENFPDGAVSLFDEELRYTAAGGELLDQLNVSSDDPIGESIYERYPDDLVETIEPHFQAALDGERSSVEVEYYGRDLYASLLPVGEDEVFSGMLLVQDITERKERERELERQREQLVALNSINEVVSEITDTVIDQSTREEIEQAVCDALAAADAYEFAWLAQVDSTTDTIEPRATARTRGYVDEISISINRDDPTGGGPGANAIREQETQIVQDVFSDPSFEPWQEAAAEYGFTAAASIPVVHEGTVYGVLAIYADRPNAFDTAEREIISRLGEIVGHAIAAAERKQALVSDELVELEFQIQDVFTTPDALVESAGTISLDHAIPLNDGEFLVYGTATPDAIDTLTGLVETFSHWEAVTVRSQGDPTSFELRLTDSSVLSVVASLGGYIEQAVIEDGDYQLTIHLAPSVDIRQVIDTVEAAYSQVEILRRQQITRSPDDPQRVQQQLMADLTDRQRAALDASYHAGFFEWPRRSSGEEVAESLGVAPPTFHQHLRKAERKVFDSLYSTTHDGLDGYQ